MTSLNRILPVVFLASTLIRSEAAPDIMTHPDNSTAWILQNDEFLWGGGMSREHWLAAANTFEVEPSENGLRITSNPVEGGGIPSATRYMSFDPDYPWLQFDVSDAGRLEGYSALTMYIPGEDKTFVRSCVGELPEGRYVTRLTPNASTADTGVFPLRLDISGLQFVLKDFSMRKDPLPRITVDPVDSSIKVPGIGDEMKVTVYLADPAEDVSVELFNSYLGTPLKIKTSGSLQLKPEDSEGKIWAGTFDLQKMIVKPVEKGKPVPAGRLLFKATILGGNFPQPLMTWNEQAWEVNP
ncbi:MAG: hypothetical protein ACK5LK_04815 [Chthoniobacterales bacterium]